VDFKIGIFPINDATAPAWLMVFLWSIYTVLLVAFFTEPVRHHHRHRADSHDKQTDREGSPRPDLTRDLVKSDSEIDILLLSTPVKKINSWEDPEIATISSRTSSVGHEKETTGLMDSTHQARAYGGVMSDKIENSQGSSYKEPSGLPLFKALEKKSSASASMLRTRVVLPVLLMVLRNTKLMTTLAVYFLIELVDEILLSSAGLIAHEYFDWTISNVGVFLAILGLFVMPANYLVGKASEVMSDRTILIISQAVTIGGLLVILSYWHQYSEFQYLVGTSVIFIAVAVMEGVDTSLMSKVIPPVLSRGTFNSGLLAVQVGTLAKAIGDGMITVIGLSAEELVDGLYFPILIITVAALYISVKCL